jgi:hypothetical protein
MSSRAEIAFNVVASLSAAGIGFCCFGPIGLLAGPCTAGYIGNERARADIKRANEITRKILEASDNAVTYAVIAAVGFACYAASSWSYDTNIFQGKDVTNFSVIFWKQSATISGIATIVFGGISSCFLVQRLVFQYCRN